MRNVFAIACALSLSVIALVPARAEVVIYRCTDANGAVTVQNDTPCPKGSKQTRRVVETPTSSATPAYVETPAIAPEPIPTIPTIPTPMPQPVAATPASTIPDGERLPPPPIFECTTYDNDRYLSDDGTPSERCVPLDITGIGDGSAPGVGAACQKQVDTCQRVPDGAACDAWKRREREARASVMFGKAEDKDKNEAEYERVQRVVTESTCGG
ncbi:MAG TPA: DUF4124 domain-containing protein [Lysobacter sp.]|nr:DUF4124 domain-containing protein [Lysobacter sp.]